MHSAREISATGKGVDIDDFADSEYDDVSSGISETRHQWSARMFKRRIGPDPHANGEMTSNAQGCPDIWELEDGNFAIIGSSATDALKGVLPATASCGDDESIVVIPRKLLLRAKASIPSE